MHNSGLKASSEFLFLFYFSLFLFTTTQTPELLLKYFSYYIDFNFKPKCHKGDSCLHTKFTFLYTSDEQVEFEILKMNNIYISTPKY